MGGIYIPKKDNEGHSVSRPGNVKLDEFLRVRHKGIMDATINAGQTLNIDYKMEQLSYQGVNKPSLMIGIKYSVSGGNNGDNVDFQIIDIDNVLGYGANTVLDEFGDGVYVFPDEIGEMREHQATLIPNVYIRAVYRNTGASQARFICNLLRYVDTK